MVSQHFCLKDRLVELGDLLSELKRVQEGLLGRFERERKIPNTLLITGSGVRVPHHPHIGLTCGTFSESRRCIHLIEKGYTARYGCIPTISSHLDQLLHIGR